MLRILKSKSAAERIAAAMRFVQSFPPATEMLLVGSCREAIDDLVRGFPAANGATFGLHRFSLTQLAALLAAPKLARDGLVPATSLGNDAVAARAVYEALAHGELTYFGPVACFPGFARATAATLGELRSAAVTAEDLDLLQAPSRDNAALLRHFDGQLAVASIADRTVLLRTAAQTVGAGGTLVRCPALFLDVPIHSAAEQDFVVALAESSPDLLFTCPVGDARTLLALEALPRSKEVVTGPIQFKSSLARLGYYLFSEAAPPEGKANDEVVFFSAPGEERECVEISRRIMEEAGAGVRFDQVAILLRNLGSYSGLMETALRRASIPGFFVRGSRRPDPSGRALLALLACAADGLSAHRFAEYLSFAQVPPLSASGEPRGTEPILVLPQDEALGAISSVILSGAETRQPPDGEREVTDHEGSPELEGSLRTPWKWEHLIVEAAVIGGKDRWVRRLDGLEKQILLEREAGAKDDPGSPRLQGLERSLRNLQHLRAFALPIIAELAALPGTASWGEWISCLEKLIPKVLRRPERVLAVLADMKPMAPVESVSLQEVRTVLHPWLANVQEQQPEYRYGRVFVGTPEQGRGRSFEIVFVPGLAERVFPQKLREDPLLLDNLRKELSPKLRVLADRSQQERLLLQVAVGAARRRLYLSYPRLEIAEARPRVPSFYALDVVRSITGRVPDYEELAREAERAGDSRLAWPAPRDPIRAIDDSEYDLATLWPLLTRGVERKGRLAYVMQLNEHLARSLRSRWARWKREWSQYDGLCKKSEAVTEILENYQLSSRPYSVSALQKFAVCPYQFLLSGIYRLEPRQEPAPIEQVDPLTRGEMFHRVQAELLRKLQQFGELPLTDSKLPAALKQLDQTVDDVAKQYHEELAPAIDRVWEDAVESMRADLRVWLEKLAAVSGWIPIHFEFGFGFKAREGRDPASLPEAVTLPSGEKLHGFVDLIEQSVDGQHLRVTDHKTGKNYMGKGLVVGQGEVLQPVLYGLAVETGLKQPVVESRFSFCTAAGGFSERIIPLNQIARESGSAVLRTIQRAIASGFLVPAPRKEACSRCDFQEVCGPYEDIRIGQKDEHSQLVHLKAVRDLA
jgi:ATP-dependent helicase/nuclease subunit B